MNTPGCRISFAKTPHSRKCEVCDMPSATLYLLQVGKLEFRICCMCKSTLRSDIDKVDGPDCY
jgi:hypothetical protein